MGHFFLKTTKNVIGNEMNVHFDKLRLLKINLKILLKKIGVLWTGQLGWTDGQSAGGHSDGYYEI